MFSHSLKYSLRALTFLATHSSSEQKFKLYDIASQVSVPAPYLGKLLQELSKNQVVSSSKGPKGGFYLSDENRKVKLERVVFLVDGNEKYENCLLNFEHCNPDKPCTLHNIFNPLISKLNAQLQQVSIGDLNEFKSEKY